MPHAAMATNHPANNHAFHRAIGGVESEWRDSCGNKVVANSPRARCKPDDRLDCSGGLINAIMAVASSLLLRSGRKARTMRLGDTP